MRLPSIKTLATITHDMAGAMCVRRMLEDDANCSLCSTYPHKLLAQVSHYIRKGCGTESIPKGHNAKSPAIDYVNCGDPYITTLMFVVGRGYVVGCWGDIVERGNYD